ncbi:PHP domain-containing protein [Jeotgalibacillus sp. R-1-5s-1]|uniref:PHP domain-containing protein n=1 Tax=Jeotgalibacillus sp. R-1-5s-1 TaxID=2555897 RepID=UPI00106BF45A|nr:PHP domain-containing protein [Jeotgalibacillus sp. R-1-5s-1]TFD96615.1 PHP domain-containing protein [Jeotgalibacillus sp. R-1-5s-1]
MLDLHMHSTASDGADSPALLVQKAKQAGVELMSITDHDSIGAYEEAAREAQIQGIHLITGIELNTSSQDGEFHVLGYGFDLYSTALADYLNWRVDDRMTWNQQLVQNLQSLGYEIEWEDVQEVATGSIIVRTHIAEALKKRGYFETAEEAYHSLLIKGKPAFEPRADFSVEEAISLIHQAGGKAFLAHPGLYTEAVPIERYLEAGLDGIEVFHARHRLKQTAYWLGKASDYGCLISGGSDYHGEQSKNPGPIGSVTIPDAIKRYWLKEAGR